MMWQPREDQLERALIHATNEMPKEACGVIVDGRFIPVANEAYEPDTFAMERESYLQAVKSGTLEAIVHSHVYAPPIASQADQAMCEATAVPWLIVSVPTSQWTVIEPSGYVAPLIGRQWCLGSLDCWGLARDAFRAFTGIQLPDVERHLDWWLRGANIIVDNADYTGFVFLPQDTTPRHCDLIIMQVRSPVPNHVGLYIEPEGLLLHHLAYRVSVRETYGGVYRQATVNIARHRNFIDYPPPPHDRNDRSIWTGEIPGMEPT